MRNRVQDVVEAVGNMPRRKQAVVVALAILVLLTWLAFCVVLASVVAG